jgi:hypothetical protein
MPAEDRQVVELYLQIIAEMDPIQSALLVRTLDAVLAQQQADLREPQVS